MTNPFINAYLKSAYDLKVACDYDQATTLYRSILNAAPYHWEALYGLADTYYINGQSEQAIALLTDATTHHQEAIFYCWLGRFQRLHQQYPAAVVALEKAYSLNPAHLEIRYEYGLALAHVLPLRQGNNFDKLSVIIPSRFARNPVSGDYWLARCIQSIRAQTAAQNLPIEICVGIDPGLVIPPEFQNQPDMAFAELPSDGPQCQAAAVNAAARLATGNVYALLEDDDYWHPARLAEGLERLHYYDFISCSQTAITNDGIALATIFDYANPSTWLMRKSQWDKAGPMDETFRFHLDAEWLGRLNKTGAIRCHQVDHALPELWADIAATRAFFMYYLSVANKGSTVHRTVNPAPLSFKTVHADSTTEITAVNDDWKQQSDAEHHRMETMYDGRPF